MSGLASQLVERRVDECLRAPEFLHRIHPRLAGHVVFDHQWPREARLVQYRQALSMTGSIIAQGGSIRSDLKFQR
jgi:hypothetical protein